jgi:hypothetical protein
MIEENGQGKKMCCIYSIFACLFVLFFCKKVFKKYIYESHSEDNKKVEWLKGKCVCVCMCVCERESMRGCVCEREREGGGAL